MRRSYRFLPCTRRIILNASHEGSDSAIGPWNCGTYKTLQVKKWIENLRGFSRRIGVQQSNCNESRVEANEQADLWIQFHRFLDLDGGPEDIHVIGRIV